VISKPIFQDEKDQSLEEKPDFVFRPLRPSDTSSKSQSAGFREVALFVDGCFWHGCPKHSNIPRNNQKFWAKKLEGNMKLGTGV
jgi:G:T-mismatch repair DNA endonuclease (very short patch repair protein)